MPLKTPKQRNQKQVYQSAILIQLNQTQTRLKMANRITNLRQTPQMTRLKGTRNFRMVWKVCSQIYRLTPRMVQSLISAVAMRFNKSRYNYISCQIFGTRPCTKFYNLPLIMNELSTRDLSVIIREQENSRLYRIG